MLYTDRRQPGSKKMLIIGLATTIFIHGGIIALVVVGRVQADAKAATPPIGSFVDVQAVKFGKPRDLSFLPHKEAAQVNRGPKPKLLLTDNEQALPRIKDDEKKPEQEDPLKNSRAQEFKRALEDDAPNNTVEGEGDPNGLRGGTSTVGRGPIYYQHLQAAVQNAWVVPTTIRDDELQKMKAQACIKINMRGEIIEFKIVKPSGNEGFDSTLANAVNSLKDLEPPTPDVRDVVTSEGVCMNFAKTR